jgi:hypothetical protein
VAPLASPPRQLIDSRRPWIRDASRFREGSRRDDRNDGPQAR